MGQTGIWTTKVHQHPERAVPQRAQEFLVAGKIAHIGFVQDGLPYVVPTLYQYSSAQPDHIHLHGGMSSRMLEELAKGIPVCVTVTELDGLVYSRDAKYHSANYRCVMCFGRGHIIKDEAAKRAMFEEMTLRYFPGRTAGRDYTPAPSSHLNSTEVVEVIIEQTSAKMREGGPKGPQDADPNAPGTCGVTDV
jgi:uncharacterized protein